MPSRLLEASSEFQLLKTMMTTRGNNRPQHDVMLIFQIIYLCYDVLHHLGEHVVVCKLVPGILTWGKDVAYRQCIISNSTSYMELYR